jgi:hypothetical protein
MVVFVLSDEDAFSAKAETNPKNGLASSAVCVLVQIASTYRHFTPSSAFARSEQSLFQSVGKDWHKERFTL